MKVPTQGHAGKIWCFAPHEARDQQDWWRDQCQRWADGYNRTVELHISGNLERFKPQVVGSPWRWRMEVL